VKEESVRMERKKSVEWHRGEEKRRAGWREVKIRVDMTGRGQRDKRRKRE